MTTLTAFYASDGPDRFLPRPEARSPWSDDMMHGRLLAGLAATTVEAHYLTEQSDPADHRGGADRSGLTEVFRPARLTIDLFRSPPMETVSTRHRLIRDGRRVRVVEVTLTVGDQDVAQATVVLLRMALHPEGEIWTRPNWTVPKPSELPAPPIPAAQSVSSMEIRAIDGQGMGSSGQRRVWLRDARGLIDDRPLSAFERAVMAADLASPLGNSGAEGLAFINADITVYLGRLPSGDWLGLEVGAHVGSEGIAVSRSDLFDTQGLFGFTDVCAVATPRMGD